MTKLYSPNCEFRILSLSFRILMNLISFTHYFPKRKATHILQEIERRFESFAFQPIERDFST